MGIVNNHSHTITPYPGEGTREYIYTVPDETTEKFGRVYKLLYDRHGNPHMDSKQRVRKPRGGTINELAGLTGNQFNVALEKMRKALAKTAPAFLRFEASYASIALRMRDRRGKNLVKGKERKKLKLIMSKFKRGLL